MENRASEGSVIPWKLRWNSWREEGGNSWETLLMKFPDLEREDIPACVAFTTKVSRVRSQHLVVPRSFWGMLIFPPTGAGAFW